MAEMKFHIIESDVMQRKWLERVLETSRAKSALSITDEWSSAQDEVLMVAISAMSFEKFTSRIAQALLQNHKVFILSTSPPFAFFKGFEKELYWIEKPFTAHQLIQCIRLALALG